MRVLIAGSTIFRSVSRLQPLLWRLTSPTTTTKTFQLDDDGHRRFRSSLAKSLVANSPKWASPYLRLARVDSPIGTWLLFWPCGWGLSMAAGPTHILPDPKLFFTFVAGTWLIRGAGCVVNDIFDRKLDAQVERTKSRPLAAGELDVSDAIGLLSAQLGLSLWLLTQLNFYSLILGCSSFSLIVVYPLMKRITNWPQLTLGLAFNWGILLGWSAVRGSIDLGVCLPLYIAGISWTLIYDTIYAFQDRKDDLIVGIKSTAITLGKNSKRWLSVFALSMITNLLIAGVAAQQTAPYYVFVTGVALHLMSQIANLKPNNVEDCRRKFLSNRHLGMLIFIGIVLGNIESILQNTNLAQPAHM